MPNLYDFQYTYIPTLIDAMHGCTDESAENLAKGQTFVSITDGKQFRDRSYDFGGRGIPDRTRMSFNAIDLVRLVLEEGF